MEAINLNASPLRQEIWEEARHFERSQPVQHDKKINALYLRLLVHILVGFLISSLFYDIGNDGAEVLLNLGFLIFNILSLIVTSMIIAILSFPLEISIFDIFFQLIFSITYVSIVYYFTSQPIELFRYLLFIAGCLPISFVGQSIGLVIGSVKNIQKGIFVVPTISVLGLMIFGYFISFKYGFEVTVLALYEFGREKLKCDEIYCHFKNPKTTIDELDMVYSNIIFDISILIVTAVISRIIALVVYRWKSKTDT